MPLFSSMRSSSFEGSSPATTGVGVGVAKGMFNISHLRQRMSQSDVHAQSQNPQIKTLRARKGKSRFGSFLDSGPLGLFLVIACHSLSSS